jgi:hypothetical protein
VVRRARGGVGDRRSYFESVPIDLLQEQVRQIQMQVGYAPGWLGSLREIG